MLTNDAYRHNQALEQDFWVQLDRMPASMLCFAALAAQPDSDAVERLAAACGTGDGGSVLSPGVCLVCQCLCVAAHVHIIIIIHRAAAGGVSLHPAGVQGGIGGVCNQHG